MRTARPCPPGSASRAMLPPPRAAALPSLAQRAPLAGGCTSHLSLQQGGGAGAVSWRCRPAVAGQSVAGLARAAEGSPAQTEGGGGKWEARYAELEEYKARFGDCKVPYMWEENPQLGVWVNNQRAAYKKGMLEASRQERLEGLGIVWKPRVGWEVRFAELEEYKARFGDCKVPSKWEENPQLGAWVINQRAAYKKGMEASRQERLEGLGFVWALEVGWESRYAELEEYKARFGDCIVSSMWEENPQLGAWVINQRAAYKKGMLEASRQERLEGLGFMWGLRARAGWEVRYAELEEYKARFGDCKVPSMWEENPPLGAWVINQRAAYKKGMLEASRQERLKGLGFVWALRGPKKEMS